MPLSVSYTLTPAEEAAVGAIVARENSATGPNDLAWTAKSYCDARIREVFNNYASQEASREAADIALRYQRANPGQKTAARNALPPLS